MRPFYASNRFDTNPLCPDQSNLFNLPNPGAPWDDWPPLRCMKTRPTASGNQLKDGFMDRFFGVGQHDLPFRLVDRLREGAELLAS